MALGGETVITTVEGRERYSANVRYPRALKWRGNQEFECRVFPRLVL